MDVSLRVPIGRWRLEEGSAGGGSGTADGFLAVSGLLRLALYGFEVHVYWMYCVREGDGCCSELRWMVIV
jgi:hypothetical protein